MIRFTCPSNLKDVIPDPIPAKKATPKWLAQMNSFIKSDTAKDGETVKKCMPFLDAMTLGYTIPLWSDVAYKATDNNVNLSWRESIFEEGGLFENHGSDQIKGTPISEQSPFGLQPMKFKNPWVIETDPGVSCLFVSPLNHFQDLFALITGVVDTDTYFNNINFPFVWMKPNCAGVLKQGTPLVQVIPFRRDDGRGLEVSALSQEDIDRREKIVRKLGTQLYDGYRNCYRHSKADSVQEKE